jgi:hypothetical protein
MIVLATETGQLRGQILATLERHQSNTEKKLRILDVGGGKNSWLGSLVTDVIDLDPQPGMLDGVQVWQGDVQDDALWNNFSRDEFDFVSCTHTLEDIRDPARVVNQISRVGKRGLFSTPNRFQELSHVESFTWLGNYHHRWIFCCSSGRYECVAKWHYINPVAQSKFAKKGLRLCRGLLPRRLRNALEQTFPRIERPWKSENSLRTFSSPSFDELSVVWLEGISLSYFNDDLCGQNPKVSSHLVSSFLSGPKLDIPGIQESNIEYLLGLGERE